VPFAPFVVSSGILFMKRKQNVRWISCFLYTIVVTALSLLPSGDLPAYPIPYLDKIGHFGMYGVFALLLVWAIRTRALNRLQLFIVGLFCVAYGIVMEVLQRMLCHGDRHFEIGDIVANTAGVVVALLFIDWFYRRENSAAQTPADADK
jgi:VanZ family protein